MQRTTALGEQNPAYTYNTSPVPEAQRTLRERGGKIRLMISEIVSPRIDREATSIIPEKYIC